MLTTRKQRLLTGANSGRLCAAVVFLVFAGFSALVHAATRSVEGLEFDTVVLYGNSEVEISMGDENSLRLRGSDSELDKQPFHVRGNTLYLGRSESRKKFKNMQFKVVAKVLKKIALKGSGEIYVKPIETRKLDVTLDGSGEIYLFSVTADELDVAVAGSGNIQLAKARVSELNLSVAGSGDVDLGEIQATTVNAEMSGSGDILASEEGSTDMIDISLAGSGDIDLKEVRSLQAEIRIAGSGDVEVWAESELEAVIMGSGDVVYRGDPKVESRVLGSGEVSSEDED